MVRRRITAALGLAGIGAAVLAIARHRAPRGGHDVPGGVVMDDANSYDAMSRLLMGPLFAGIAADIASQVQTGDRLLEVGCGPGHLSVRLARDHGLSVTGLDLDPGMIERARLNAARELTDGRRPEFVVGDVAALPFPDASFDMVISTMSMHHWEDASAGLADIGRVLRPGGRALIWDLKPGGLPFHRHMPDAATMAESGKLTRVSSTPWHWPWRFSFSQRTEFQRAD